MKGQEVLAYIENNEIGIGIDNGQLEIFDPDNCQSLK